MMEEFRMTVIAADVERFRPRLFGLAYRMLGSRQDAEDVVQEALLRWHRTDTREIDSPEAWLVTVTSRLCIDRLRSLSAERAAYVGPWLPEPLVADDEQPDRRAELASDLSLALLLVLERLSPDERAAFLLHDVFDYGYPQIAAVLGKTEAACRQMIHRARERIRCAKPRFAVSAEAHRRLVESYMHALEQGDAAGLAALLAPDAVFVSDGGGKTTAARRPLRTARSIVRLEMGVRRRFGGAQRWRIARVNGQAGLLAWLDGRLQSVTYFETDGQRILAVFRVLNPDKLRSDPDPSVASDGVPTPA